MIRNTYTPSYWYPILAWERVGVGALIMDHRIKDYPNLYQKRNVDVLNPNLHATIGWDTTSKSRKIMIDEIESWGFELRHQPWRMCDRQLYQEATTFVWVKRGGSGRFEAQKGTDKEGNPHHDDLIMALGGALSIDKLIPESEPQEEPPEKVPEIKDEYFRRAISYRNPVTDGDTWAKAISNDPWANAVIPDYHD